MTISLKDKSILVIDDEQLILDIVKTLIKSHGGEAEGLSNGDKAVSLTRENTYDLIVLDRHMPDMDGLDVLNALKKDKATQNVPVLMLTGERSEKEIKRCIAAGAIGYIAKPFQPKRLLFQIAQILGVLNESDEFEVDV